MCSPMPSHLSSCVPVWICFPPLLVLEWRSPPNTCEPSDLLRPLTLLYFQTLESAAVSDPVVVCFLPVFSLLLSLLPGGFSPAHQPCCSSPPHTKNKIKWIMKFPTTQTFIFVQSVSASQQLGMPSISHWIGIIGEERRNGERGGCCCSCCFLSVSAALASHASHLFLSPCSQILHLSLHPLPCFPQSLSIRSPLSLFAPPCRLLQSVCWWESKTARQEQRTTKWDVNQSANVKQIV